jgi:hypothetical protein
MRGKTINKKRSPSGICGWIFIEELEERVPRERKSDPWYKVNVTEYPCGKSEGHEGDHVGIDSFGTKCIWPVDLNEPDPRTYI